MAPPKAPSADSFGESQTSVDTTASNSVSRNITQSSCVYEAPSAPEMLDGIILRDDKRYVGHSNGIPYAAALVEEAEDKDALTDIWGEKFAIRETSCFRRIWSLGLAVMMIYVATLLPYKLCFLEFRVPDPYPDAMGWVIVSWLVDVFFWCDLPMSFLMSYRDKHGREVTRLSRIAWNYGFSAAFIVDLISCLPPKAFELFFAILLGTSEGDSKSVNKSARLMRLNRLPRLAKIIRVMRLAKIFRFIRDSPVWRKLLQVKGFKEINFMIGFILVAHLMACGWYLVGSLHGMDQIQKTWIARRDDSTAFLSEGPVDQWLHSLYFVLTVFTTVGFGDISGFTTAEMAYCILTMIIGTLANSIIMGQVINIMSASDQLSVQREEQATLIRNFAEHTQLEATTAQKFFTFIKDTESIHRGYDRDQVKMLLNCSVFPRELEGEIPLSLFKGELIRNKLLRVGLAGREMPMHFPIYIALAVHQRFMVCSDMVYWCGDQPTSIHLVLTGVFASLQTRRSKKTTQPPNENQLLTSSSRYSAVNKECAVGESFPCKIFCRRSYFGDTEVLFSREARSTSMRCEADGSMLVFDKHDLANIMQEFPHQVRALTKEAMRRDLAQHAYEKKSRIHHYKDYSDLAAWAIQRKWRRLVAEGKDVQMGAWYSNHHQSEGMLEKCLVKVRSEMPEEKPEVYESVVATRKNNKDLAAKVDAMGNDLQRLNAKVDKLTALITQGFEGLLQKRELGDAADSTMLVL